MKRTRPHYHPWAKGSHAKVGPSYPYQGGYNQRTEKQAAAIELKALGGHLDYPRMGYHYPQLTPRREKKVIKLWELHDGIDQETMKTLGAQQRRYVRALIADACAAIDHKMWLNAL